MIRLDNISLRYGDTQVLSKLSTDIPNKGITSIIGPNGAGKSSLLSVASAQIKATNGVVSFNGQSLESLPRETLAKQLAYLKQDNQIGARISVKDLVCFGRFPYHRGRPSPEDWVVINETIHYFQLSDIQDRYLDQLSGGQRQRAFIAMVWAQDTPYLFLDEPLNNLDMKHSGSIMKHLKQACYALDKSIVVVLHDINFASYYSDHIIALKQGELFKAGSPAQVINSDCLSTLYDMPIEIAQVEGVPVCLYFK
ncbi:ATP-binding cassette domain-containing protein [Reinekea marina]|uniref:ABC transporter ATP-binding protein n=1 Tax=Reinekea marina TaxID=1310421 RepID=A0ABV7WQI0_9GAMM|nr:ATP-binding cassette domain-containing protein [Reinekea marina]MDN3648184.1 ATP-binding cassette domain-containing protein [Reinekea marina]